MRREDSEAVKNGFERGRKKRKTEEEMV